MLEKRLLQLVIFLGGFVPVIAGGMGAIEGEALLNADLRQGGDSHFRYLSGLLLGIGILFWACIRSIERRGATIRVLTAVVVAGGLARAVGWLIMGDPGPMRWALVMELGVTPLICLWQARVARLYAAPARS